MYTGTPGSGKSLHVAKEIYWRIKNRKNVICNFEFRTDIFEKIRHKGIIKIVDNWDLKPQLLYDFCKENHVRDYSGHMIEGQTLLVIDECQLIFNARAWNAPDRNAWISFFTQHRKYGYNIILVTQNDRMVDRQIRSLVEFEDIHRNASYYKLWGKLLAFLCGGSLFVIIHMWYGVNLKMGSDFFRYSKKYARLYDSYKIFETEKDSGADVNSKVILGKEVKKENEKEVESADTVHDNGIDSDSNINSNFGTDESAGGS